VSKHPKNLESNTLLDEKLQEEAGNTTNTDARTAKPAPSTTKPALATANSALGQLYF
jgi:hypothetical protein